jgi:nicotinamidase/pyrazinamidase
MHAIKIRRIISKATTKETEAYSGFQGTELAGLLKGQGIQRIFVCGLATDYCVKATALDARKAGFDVVVLEDAIRGVEVQPGDCARAIEEMAAAGIRFAKTIALTA